MRRRPDYRGRIVEMLSQYGFHAREVTRAAQFFQPEIDRQERGHFWPMFSRAFLPRGRMLLGADLDRYSNKMMEAGRIADALQVDHAEVLRQIVEAAAVGLATRIEPTRNVVSTQRPGPQGESPLYVAQFGDIRGYRFKEGIGMVYADDQAERLLTFFRPEVDYDVEKAIDLVYSFDNMQDVENSFDFDATEGRSFADTERLVMAFLQRRNNVPASFQDIAVGIGEPDRAKIARAVATLVADGRRIRRQPHGTYPTDNGRASHFAVVLEQAESRTPATLPPDTSNSVIEIGDLPTADAKRILLGIQPAGLSLRDAVRRGLLNVDDVAAALHVEWCVADAENFQTQVPLRHNRAGARVYIFETKQVLKLVDDPQQGRVWRPL